MGNLSQGREDDAAFGACIDLLLRTDELPFALIHRPSPGDPLLLLTGECSTVDGIDQLPCQGPGEASGLRHELLLLDLGDVDDKASRILMQVGAQYRAEMRTAIEWLPGRPAVGAGTAGAADLAPKPKHQGVASMAPGDVDAALSLFRGLIAEERGAYWTFLIRTGSGIFIGAMPERHVALDDGELRMRRSSDSWHRIAERRGVLIDDDLKTMARLCDDGGQMVDPIAEERFRAAFVGYTLRGRCTRTPWKVLGETLSLPTVTASANRLAGQAIGRDGRVVIALIGRDTSGRQTLDAAAFVGNVEEAREPRTLPRRHDGPLAEFWLSAPERRQARHTGYLAGRVLILDAGDGFAPMLRCQFAAMSAEVTIVPCDSPFEPDRFDLVVIGSGPGDPGDAGDTLAQRLRVVTQTLLDAQRPFLSVGLGHQVLSDLLGLDVRRLAVPPGGVQREIRLLGQPCRLGFYNDFVAVSATDRLERPERGLSVEVSRDTATGEVHCLRSARFCSLQFQPESALSADGMDVLRYVTTYLMYSPRPASRSTAARTKP